MIFATYTNFVISGYPKDKVIILERELSSAQSRIAQLEAIAKGLETDKNQLQHLLKDQQRQLAEKHAQLQELLGSDHFIS